jgi:hypothetical protein
MTCLLVAATPFRVEIHCRTGTQGSLADSATAGLNDGTPLAFSAANVLLPGGDGGGASHAGAPRSVARGRAAPRAEGV